MQCDSFKIMFALGILIFYGTPAVAIGWYLYKNGQPRQLAFELTAGAVLVAAAVLMFVYCQ